MSIKTRIKTLEKAGTPDKHCGLVIATELPDGSLEIDGEHVTDLEQWRKDNRVPASALILVLDLCMQPFQGQLDEEAGDGSQPTVLESTIPPPPASKPAAPRPPRPPLPPAVPEPPTADDTPEIDPPDIDAVLDLMARERVLAEQEAYIESVLADHERKRIGYWDALRIPGARPWERRRPRRRR